MVYFYEKICTCHKNTLSLQKFYHKIKNEK